MIIDGKKIAAEQNEATRLEVAKLAGRPPSLKVILVGNNPASLVYIRRKIEAAMAVGIHSEAITLSDKTSERDLLLLIEKLNKEVEVDGILVQLPLPAQIDPQKILLAINPNKDVDGFHPINQGKLLTGETNGFIPGTPLGIQNLLLRSGVEIAGKEVVIVGRSSIVGKPLAALLMRSGKGGDATVTVAHSKTVNLPVICKRADILVAAIGRPKMITVDYVKPGAVVIDVGINSVEGKLIGDVDFVNVEKISSLITPVPGGVGPMTIASLLHNTLKARKGHGQVI